MEMVDFVAAIHVQLYSGLVSASVVKTVVVVYLK